MTKQSTAGDSFDVLAWRKSSRSSSAGGNNCVEAGAWRKSSRSDGGAGNNCVEAGTCACHGIAIRDSKAPFVGTLAITRTDWTALLSTVTN